MNKLIKNKDFGEFNKLIGKSIDERMVTDIKNFFKNKNIYTSVGVVLRPDLQGKKTGISDKMYKILSDGIVFGFTSNPIVVRQRRKLFKNTIFFPLMGQKPKSLEEWTACLYVYSSRKFPGKGDSVKGLKFGAIYSIYNVEERWNEYLEIAKGMAEKGKITKLDEKRLEYVLGKKSCASAIISWN